MSDTTTDDGREPRLPAEQPSCGGAAEGPTTAELLPSEAEFAATPEAAPRANGTRPVYGSALETTIFDPDAAPADAPQQRLLAPAPTVLAASGTSPGIDFVRPTLYVVSLFCILISMSPFTDRSGKSIIATFDVGSRVNQIFFPALLLLMFLSVGFRRLRVLRPFLRWPYVAFFLWLIPALVFSMDPLLSLRRTAFFLIQVAIACLAMLLPRSERQLAWMLAIVSGMVLLLCYGGVAVLPQLSIHQVTDIIETELAGDWRGIFRHKNEAGAVMVVLTFIGLYLMRALSTVIGATIIVLAVIFLAFTVSKSSLVLLPICLVIAFLVERCRTTTQRGLVALTLLVAFNVGTLGSSFPGPIRDTLSKVLPDVTFTGRTDLWRFAMEHVAKRPVFGYGIGAFWRTSDTMYKDREGAEPEDISGWVAELGTDSHNGYLDVAVSMGLPGAVFLVIAMVLLPLPDLDRALAMPANRNLTRFYLRCWLFVIYLSSVESLLMPLNPIWFVMMQTVFGLMLLASYRLQPTR